MRWLRKDIYYIIDKKSNFLYYISTDDIFSDKDSKQEDMRD